MMTLSRKMKKKKKKKKKFVKPKEAANFARVLNISQFLANAPKLSIKRAND